jgi:hypothetical protein
MKTTIRLIGRFQFAGVLVVAGVAGFGGGVTPLQAEDKKDEATSESPTEYRNWMTLTVGGTFGIGDNPQKQAEFQRRYGLPAGAAFGGVEDFHYEQDVGKRGLFTVDGHAVFDNHDYGVRLELSQPDVGYLRTGYREFTSYYNGAGGYFPLGPVNAFTNLYSPDMSVQNGEFFFEAGLQLPDSPQVDFRYAHRFRDGTKDSTSWGDSNLTGGVGIRSFVPSFWDLNEVRDVFSIDLWHTIDKTQVGAGLAYEHWSNNDSLNIHRRPDEPQSRYVTQNEGASGDLFNFHAFSETRFTPKVTMTLGYSFTTLDTQMSGSRIYGTSYDPVYDPGFAGRQANDAGFLDLHGNSAYQQYVGNVNVMWTPLKDVSVVTAVRAEHNDTDADSRFIQTNFGPGPAFTPSQTPTAASSDHGVMNVSESIEMRYTGFTNWVLYARGYWLEGQADFSGMETLLASNLLDLQWVNDYTEFVQQYTVGANWYPCARANIAVQGYYKTRSYDYEYAFDSTPNPPPSGNRYPAFLTAQDFTTGDANLRLTLRPVNRLTLVTRYDYQRSWIDTQAANLENVQSAALRSHIFSQSASWTPFARLWIQASGSYVIDEMDTPASTQLPTPVIQNSDNNYWNVSASAGYVLDDKTDLQVQYFFYRASNYMNNALYGMPYGVSDQEQGIVATLGHRFSAQLRGTLKYGYFINQDVTSGGLNNYYSQMVSASMTYMF